MMTNKGKRDNEINRHGEMEMNKPKEREKRTQFYLFLFLYHKILIASCKV